MPLSTNVTPLGRAPALVSAAVGDPVVVTLKVPALPAVKVVVVAEVMAGSWPSTSEKVWVVVPTVFLAVNFERIGLDRPGRGARQCGGAVAVVGEGHTRRQCPR